jgi:putative cardiolipin synthase
VFDRKTAFVGSMNMDPRSALFNTELGIVVESEKFSEQVVALFDRATQPRNSFRVELTKQNRNESGQNAALVWSTEEAGKRVRYDREPLVSWWRRSMMQVMQVLVPDQIL